MLNMRPIPKIIFVKDRKLPQREKLKTVREIEKRGKLGYYNTKFWLGSQVVRQGSAKPLYAGSIPALASEIYQSLD
jgi:hypothetical protein